MVWWYYAGGAAAAAGIGWVLMSGDKHHHKHGGESDDASTDPSAQPPDQGEGDTPEAPPLPSETPDTATPVTSDQRAPSSPHFHRGPMVSPQATQLVSVKGKASRAAKALYAQLAANGTNLDT